MHGDNKAFPLQTVICLFHRQGAFSFPWQMIFETWHCFTALNVFNFCLQRMYCFYYKPIVCICHCSFFPHELPFPVFPLPSCAVPPAEDSYYFLPQKESTFCGTFTIKDTAAIMENMYERFDKKKFLEKCTKYDFPTDKQIREFSTGMKAKFKLLSVAKRFLFSVIDITLIQFRILLSPNL